MNPEEVSDLRADFASVYDRMSVSVRMSFSLLWGNFEKRVTRAQQRITSLPR